MFLVGTAVSLKESDKYPREFFPLTRVGSGYSDIQLFELLRKLNPHWKKWDNNNPPSMIHCGREKPHVWIEPAQSVILEVLYYREHVVKYIFTLQFFTLVTLCVVG